MSQQAISLNLQPTTTTAAPRPAAKSFVGHAKLIGGLTLVSRLTGLAREIVAGHYLGAGVVASAFTVAFTIPNLFRKLFGEGALSAAFIPLYAQAVKKEEELGTAALPRGADSANAFAAATVNLLCIILLALTIVGEAIIGAILFLNHHLTEADLLTLKFAAIMLPYVLLICGTAFLGAILQVHKRFGAPAAAPIVLNVCHVAVVLIGARLLHLHHGIGDATAVKLQTTLAYWLSFFVLVAGVMQGMILLPPLRAAGFRFQPVLHVWTPAIRQMLRLTLPVAIGAGVLQLSVLLDKGLSMLLMQSPDAAGHLVTSFHLFGHVFRYPMETGAPMRLNLAQFLYQFPLGVFAIALATAIFPSLSAVALDKDREHFKSVLRSGIEATLFEGLPASIGLILIREPAVRLLFQHGMLQPHDSELISRSVLFFSAAIWAFSLQQIINRAYYALHDTVTPLVMSIVTLAVNLAVELPLVWTNLGEAGMAAGTLVSFSAQALVMLFLLDRRVGGLGLRKSVVPVLKMIVATAAMAAVCMGIQRLSFFPHGHVRIVWAEQTALIIGAGAATYLGICMVLGVDIVGQLMPRARSS
ncbi:MAG TPA: murein biosynthesis integral membrane protein MurJ [Tepidisphaeraceae bacterium]|nr:murein biosynthesis integral membrane protein MurJ [Tepidisphaeraceae bacterium]